MDFIIMTKGQGCGKFYNEVDEELSVAFDDSCGALPICGRVSVAMFSSKDYITGRRNPIGDEVFNPSEEEFLKLLADHLGYSVTKK